MVLPIALALMAGGVYKRNKQDQINSQREEEDRAALLEERNFKQQERQREVAKRDAVAQAAKPVTVTTEQMSGPTMPDQEPLPTLPKAGGKFYTSMSEATGAADAANTPEARTARVSDALLGMGDINAATKVRTDAMQEKAASLQMDDAQRKRLNEIFDQSLAGVTSFDALAETVSSSNIGGKAKVRPVVSADGQSVTFHQVQPDGSSKPTPYTFANNADGLTEALGAMSRTVPMQQKLDFVYKRANAKQQAERANQELALRGGALDETRRHNQAMEGVYASRAENAQDRMSEADKMAVAGLQRQRSEASRRLASIEDAITKAQAEGMWDEATPNAAALRQQQRQLQEATAALDLRAQGVMSRYATGGAASPADPFGLRRPAQGQGAAQSGAQVPPAVQKARDVDRLAILQQELQNARTPADREALQREIARAGGRPAQQQPASQPVVQPAAAPAAAEPAAAPVGSEFQQFLAANITTPQGKAAILRRVRAELPQLQQSILADARVMQNPNVSAEVKAALQARIAANQATAEMMQRFADGNTNLTP